LKVLHVIKGCYRQSKLPEDQGGAVHTNSPHYLIENKRELSLSSVVGGLAALEAIKKAIPYNV
jgi:hypothetical protein